MQPPFAQREANECGHYAHQHAGGRKGSHGDQRCIVHDRRLPSSQVASSTPGTQKYTGPSSRISPLAPATTNAIRINATCRSCCNEPIRLLSCDTARYSNTALPEESQAGLTINDCRGLPLYTNSYPRQYYERFEDIPPLVVMSLLFIEDRGLLDASRPNANPAVDWPRFTKAAISQLEKRLGLGGQAAGGSTLATQVEKYRHSPEGRTGDPQEKIRQMVSASVRTYREGPQTLATRPVSYTHLTLPTTPYV